MTTCDPDSHNGASHHQKNEAGDRDVLTQACTKSVCSNRVVLLLPVVIGFDIDTDSYCDHD